MPSAVVFAYHNVGVRCLRVLLAAGVDVRLVVTHDDDPGEQIWFGSVRQLCLENEIPFITPDDPNTPEVEACVADLGADFLFSFYYRRMLRTQLLQSVARGAYNMHGSLLPCFRGRVPVNWAVLCGASETGATLHQMDLKPDSGPIVDQVAVPILPDDTAREVFQKVLVAAELCLHRALPQLLDGTAALRLQDLSQGGYFGGRNAADGRIDWQQNARQIHDLVRAVTHPFPGAFSDFSDGRLMLWRARVLDDTGRFALTGTVQFQNDMLEIYPHGGGLLRVLQAEFADQPVNTGHDIHRLGGRILPTARLP